MLKLHWASASPFARKCVVCAQEAGVEMEVVARGGNAIQNENMPISENPLGKIPALERGDGPAIYDSRVITRYLDSVGSGSLYPEARIWEVLTLEATADGIMDAALLVVYEKRLRAPEAVFDDWVEGAVGQGDPVIGCH